MPLFSIPNLFLERRQQIKCYVCRLKVPGIGLRDVMSERSESRSPRRGHDLTTRNERGSVHPRQQPGCNRLYISFHAANLSGEKNSRIRLHLQSLAQQSRRVDISIAVNLPIAQKARILQTGDKTQHPRLLAKLQMILKSHQ